MAFSTTNAAEAPVNVGNGPKYLSVGINEGVAFAGFEAKTSNSGKDFLEVTFIKGEGADESKVSDKFFMTEKAQPMSLRKVKHILVDGLQVAADKVDAVTADTLEAYATALNKLIPKANSLRLKINGEEYDNGSGLKVGKRIGMPDFVEPTATTPSKLTFDKGNKYDYAALPVPDGGTPAYSSTPAIPELPF